MVFGVPGKSIELWGVVNFGEAGRPGDAAKQIAGDMLEESYIFICIVVAFIAVLEGIC
jgi:hypothetical protein